MSPLFLFGSNSLPAIILGLMIAFVLFCVATSLFEWRWNITIPGIFKVRPITFWEAFRLLLIGAMLSSGAFIHFKSGG